MSRALAVVLIACLLAAVGRAQDEDLSNDQLRRMYADAVAQLRAVQDRRNELARENERLREQVSRLQNDLADAQRQHLELADATVRIRSERAAWLAFLRSSPVIKSQWFAFLQHNHLASDPFRYLDPNWPFAALP